MTASSPAVRGTRPDRSCRWLSWECHRRSRELARAIGAELRERSVNLPRFVKYPFLLSAAVVDLVWQKPRVLFVQCPSVVLAAWACLLKRVLRYRLVIDNHNEGVNPFNCTARWYRGLTAWIQRAADLNIVTNDALREIVERNGGRGYVLPDRIPDLPGFAGGEEVESDLVVFICTYAPDEPYVAVIEAARCLEGRARIHITGNHRGVEAAVVRRAPENVRFTGFLSEEEYVRLLSSAAVIVDLTRMDDCLVCGAYEAVALGKPLVTSDTRALRSYFSKGTVYAGSDPESVARSIQRALERRDELAEEMRTLRRELEESWNGQFQGLLDLVFENRESCAESRVS